MSDRGDFGFLQPKERAYLSDEGHFLGWIDEDDPEDVAQTKYRLKNEVLANLDQVIEDFRRDLLAVANFQRECTLHEQFAWENTTLQVSQSELEHLKDIIDTLIDQAENHPISAEPEELKGILDSLYGTTDIQSRIESGERPDSEELEEVYHRRKEMNQHLSAVLSKEELPEILSYIGENGKTDLSNRRINDEGEWWAQVATRVLVPELATKDEDVVGPDQYELTKKGETVLECWKELQQTKTIQIKSNLRPEQTTREIVLETLSEYFPENYAI